MINVILQRKIDYSINLIQKAEKMALEYDSINGFYLAFSGGKDSQVIYHLAKEAGVKFKAHMNLTSVDPPEIIRFVKHKYPDVERIKPKMSIYDMALKKHILPTRRVRWCCAEFKETSGAGTVTIIGIRHAESSRRSKRNELETGDREFSGNFDQFSEHREKMVTCVSGKDKILLSPIIDWTESDVWEYLNNRKIQHCELYDKGFTRIGCICCPMSQNRQKICEIKRYPHVEKNWKKTIQKLIDRGYSNRNVQDAQMGFDWWISGKSFKQFYAETVLQQSLKFKP